jgi:hypothetical protein
MHKQKIPIVRIFNDQCLFNFKMQLRYETWDDVFNSNDVYMTFNSFLNTYLRIFHSSFPVKKKKCCSKLKTNNWITPGIRISCRHKRELYLLYRNNNDIIFKTYYIIL